MMRKNNASKPIPKQQLRELASLKYWTTDLKHYRNRFQAKPNHNRSHTWKIIDQETGETIRDNIINRDEARHNQMLMNAQVKKKRKIDA